MPKCKAVKVLREGRANGESKENIRVSNFSFKKLKKRMSTVEEPRLTIRILIFDKAYCSAYQTTGWQIDVNIVHQCLESFLYLFVVCVCFFEESCSGDHRSIVIASTDDLQANWHTGLHMYTSNNITNYMTPQSPDT